MGCGGVADAGLGAGLRVPIKRIVPLKSLLPHERVEWHHVLEILESIIEVGAVLRPILAAPVPGANGRLVILDGHHRWLALNLLGAIRAPVLLVDYERHVHLGTWRDGVRVSRRDVYERALSGRLFPPKTTRHRLLVDVSWEPTPLEELVPGCRDPCLLGGSRGQRRGQGA